MEQKYDKKFGAASTSGVT